MKKIVIIILMFASFSAYSQTGLGFTSIYYGPAIPLGGTGDYIENTSWRGIGMGFNSFVSDNVSVGLDISWLIFTEALNDEAIEYNRLTISGNQYRYINTVPILLTFKGYLGTGDLKPFAGFGIGTSWTEKLTEIGTYSIQETDWQFNIAPEIGVAYAVTPSLAPYFKVKYSYAAESRDLQSISYISFTVGLAFESQ